MGAPGLLELLRGYRRQWLSLEWLRTALSLPSAAIHTQIEALRRQGHAIEAAPVRGFRFMGQSGRLNAEMIEAGLGTGRIGRKVLVYDETDSTNDVAWHYAQGPDNDGLAVFAERQRSGRGRLGQPWIAPGGSSVLCSVLLQDERPVSGQTLTLLAGLVVAEVVEGVCQVPGRIKWPNDVTVSGKKLAGIMIETRPMGPRTCSVVGIGINCHQQQDDFPPALQATAVSLRQVTGQERVDRLELAQELLRRLEVWLGAVAQGELQRLHDGWLCRCDDVGRRITLAQSGRSFTGRVVDVCCEQGLLLQLDSGPVRFFDAATTRVIK